MNNQQQEHSRMYFKVKAPGEGQDVARTPNGLTAPPADIAAIKAAQASKQSQQL